MRMSHGIQIETQPVITSLSTVNKQSYTCVNKESSVVYVRRRKNKIKEGE